MLIIMLLYVFTAIFSLIFSWFPVVTTLPFGIDGALWTVGQWIAQVTAYIWPLDIVFTIFFHVYLPFQITLLLLKFFLGHRAPGRDVQ